MDVVPGLVDFLFFTAAVLLWTKWSKLDLGLRTPGLKSAWPWILVFIAWSGAETAMTAVHPTEVDPVWLERVSQLSLLETILLAVVMVPIWEELLFRGAMFSALQRRWGVAVAAGVPSLLWALLHVQYEWWVVASIAGAGVILAIIRWKSGSLYPPLVLHAAGNLLATLNLHGMLGATD